MKNLNRLGLLIGFGSMLALSFSVGGCSDDPEPTGGTAGKGGTGSSGSSTGGKGGTGGSSGSTGTSGSATGGSGGSTAGTGGTGGATGGSGGSGGSTGGSGGSTAGSGGSGGSTGGSGGSGGSGGGGGSGGAAVSAACLKLCEGADSIGTVCATENNVDATLKSAASCKTRCAKETDASKVTCWQDHVNNSKGAGSAGEKTTHCGHAGGMAPCMAWPAP